MTILAGHKADSTMPPARFLAASFLANAGSKGTGWDYTVFSTGRKKIKETHSPDWSGNPAGQGQGAAG
jgi:hypothetical protein